MPKGLEGIKVIEVGGAAAMPLAGMLMAGWGAEVIHVEPPGRGDMMRTLLKEGAVVLAMLGHTSSPARDAKAVAVRLLSDPQAPG